jgi:hypothetical protein
LHVSPKKAIGTDPRRCFHGERTEKGLEIMVVMYVLLQPETIVLILNQSSQKESKKKGVPHEEEKF